MTPRTGKQEAGRSPFPVLFQQAKDLMVGQLHQRLAEEGFSGVLYWHGPVFRHIDEEGSRLTTLAERSGLTKQAIGEVVADLERLGYVERTADPDDRRAKIIRLTGRGVDAQVAAGRILGDIERRWTEHLGEDGVATLRRTLEDLIRAERP